MLLEVSAVPVLPDEPEPEPEPEPVPAEVFEPPVDDVVLVATAHHVASMCWRASPQDATSRIVVPMPNTPTPRDATRRDQEAIKQLAVASGLFSSDEVSFLDEPLEGFFDGSLQGHRWLVLEADGHPQAAAYLAPEPFADRMWNLYFIAVDPAAQGGGSGTTMVAFIESQLRALGPELARTLIVETSSTDAFASTRAFYERRGFEEEARIRQFYGPDDHKVVFWKSLV